VVKLRNRTKKARAAGGSIMVEFLDQVTKENYQRFLDSPCPYTIQLCPDCRLTYSHPMIFCKECPGKIVDFKGTWRKYTEVKLEHMRQLRNKKKLNFNYHSYLGPWYDALPVYGFEKFLGRKPKYDEKIYEKIREIGRAIFPEFSDLWGASDKNPQ
jgi:hypothetical protein